MPKKQFIDFKAVKAAVTMEQVLQHYGILSRFKKSGDSLSGPCPIHKGTNTTQFRVSISKNIFNCFSECKNGGNVLDFIARMEDITIHAAALKAIEWFNLDVDAMSAEADHEPEPSDSPVAKKAAKAVVASENAEPNPPLKFRLEKLQREHPYLIERGLTLETIVDFGIGFCAKGMMKDHIAIPIHNPSGQVVAYAGRWPGQPDENTPKYKLPPGFRKSQELFNVDRLIQASPERPLVIVEGFFDCMKLWQMGVKRVVALMGSTMSFAQEELLRQHLRSGDQIIVMLDEDEAGQIGRDEITVRLAKFAFVKVHVFGKEGMQPENLTANEVTSLL